MVRLPGERLVHSRAIITLKTIIIVFSTNLQDELKENPEVTLLVEFYTVWSPPCKKLSEPFAEVSLKYFSVFQVTNDFIFSESLKK